VCSSNARHTQDRKSARHYKRLHRPVLTPSGPSVTKSSAVTDIRFSEAFRDILEVAEDGTLYIDYGKFHDVEPLSKP
jgi:hypothetical protein